MRFVEAIRAGLGRRRGRITSSEDLSAFLNSRSAFISQKCVTEFCRVRAGVYWEKLFREAPFQDALMRSTWLSYTPVQAMLGEMIEGVLRPVAPVHEEQALRDALVTVAAKARDELVPPRPVDKDAWAAQAGLVTERLAQAGLAAPRPVRDLASPLARNVFDVLPIHESLLTHDFDYIFNNLRMNVLRAHEDFLGSVEPADVVRELVGRTTGAAGGNSESERQ
jgi:hypothetical protein